MLTIVLAVSLMMADAAPAHPLITVRMNASRRQDDYRQIVEINRRHPGSVDEFWFGRAGAGPRIDILRDIWKKQLPMKELCEKAGIRCGFQQGTTLGHGSIYSSAGAGQIANGNHPFTDDAWQVTKDGRRVEMFCPRSQEVLRYEEEYAAALGETLKPVSLWLDDDLRMGYCKDDGCYCKRCLAAFGAEFGQKVTREELVRRLAGGEKKDPIRRAWRKFLSDSLAIYGAAARRGTDRTNPSCLVAYQSVEPMTLESGRDYEPLLKALSGDGKHPTSIRIGSLCYGENLDEIVYKMLGVAFETERLSRSGLRLSALSYEQEIYQREALHKTPEAIAVESALALANGCDAVTEYYWDEKRHEPLFYYEEFAATMAAWRPYFKRLAEISRTTSLGGIARFIGSDYDLCVKSSVRSGNDQDLAGIGVPLTVSSSGTRFHYVNEDTLTEWGPGDAERLFADGGVAIVTPGAVKGLRAVGGEIVKAAEASGRLKVFDIASRAAQRYPTHAERAAMLDVFDSLAGDRLPVRVDRAHRLYVYPRIDRKTRRTVAVTFYNGAAGSLLPTEVRIRRPAGAKVVWLRPESSESTLTARKGDGDELVVRTPSIPARQVATLLVLDNDAKYLDEMDLSSASCGYGGRPQSRKSFLGNPLTIGTNVYSRGVGVHAESAIVLRANGRVKCFDAIVGLDKEIEGQKYRAWNEAVLGTIRFRIIADGKKVWESPVISRKKRTPPLNVHVNLEGARIIALEAMDCLDWASYAYAHADWAEARFTLGSDGAIEVVGKDDPLVAQWGVIGRPKSQMPRINGPKVWGVRPGHPVDYYLPIAGEQPIEVEVGGDIPEGVTFDAARRMLVGCPARAGAYRMIVKAGNRFGRTEREFTLKVGETISLTPPLGWNSWNCFGAKVTDADIRRAADAIVATGLREHGWMYVNLDDGWTLPHAYEEVTPRTPTRTKEGRLLTAATFPDMKALADYIHSKGLRAGLYSSPGRATCGRFEGSYGHEEIDAATWADWGFDYLKYDWCGYQVINRKPACREEFSAPFAKMYSILRRQKRDMVLAICQYGMGNVSTWARSCGNLWRATGDLKDEWGKIYQAPEKLFEQSTFSFAGPGCWADLDMMTFGRVSTYGKHLHPCYLSNNEQYTHLALWAMTCSPILLGCDLTQLDDLTLSYLSNDDLLDIHQDALGCPALCRVAESGAYAIWKRPLDDGSTAIAIVNRLPYAQEVRLNFAREGLPWRVRQFDVWRNVDLGTVCLESVHTIPAHATLVLKCR